MSGLMCCIWWFLLGLLLGWLLNWLLAKMSGKDAPPPAAYVAPMAAPVAAPVALPVVAPLVAPLAAAAVIAPVLAAKVGGVDLKAAATAGFLVRGDDDLKIIEGIGPKIDQLLKDNGIHTFAELAKASVAEITAILDKGGSRFKLANPSTWAKQSLLCAENRWAELKVLQDELDAGVEVVKTVGPQA